MYFLHALSVVMVRARVCAFKRSIITIIYPLTARVVGAPQMILQPVSSIFPCSPLPSWTWRTLLDLANNRPVHTLMLSSNLFLCLPCSLSLAAVKTIQLQFASLYDRQEICMWSNCLLDLGTDFLVGNMVFV